MNSYVTPSAAVILAGEIDSALAELLAGSDLDVFTPYEIEQLLPRCATMRNRLDAWISAQLHHLAGTQSHRVAGHTDVANRGAQQLGITPTEVARKINTARRLDRLTAVADAARSGQLSERETELIAGVAADHPETQARLLAAAGRGIQPLKDECWRVRRELEADDDLTHRLRSRRGYRSWFDDDGMYNGRLRLPPELGAEIKSAIADMHWHLYRNRRPEDIDDTPDNRAADALSALILANAPAPEPSSRDMPAASAPQPSTSPAPPPFADRPNGRNHGETEDGDVHLAPIRPAAAGYPTTRKPATSQPATAPAASGEPVTAHPATAHPATAQAMAASPEGATSGIGDGAADDCGELASRQDAVRLRHLGRSGRPKQRLSNVIVDFNSLRHGRLQLGGRCEIPGVGPASVAWVRTLLPRASLKFVIVDRSGAHDRVRTVCHLPRRVPPELVDALTPARESSPLLEVVPIEITDKQASYTVIVVIDLVDLRTAPASHNAAIGGGTIDIAGAGSIDVERAANLLSPPGLDIVARTATALDEIVTSSRHPPAKLLTALLVRGRECGDPDCHRRGYLELDHTIEYSRGGLTSWHNNSYRCSIHHREKTVDYNRGRHYAALADRAGSR